MEHCQKKKSRQEALNLLSPLPFLIDSKDQLISFKDSNGNLYKATFSPVEIPDDKELNKFQLLEFSFNSKKIKGGNCEFVFHTIAHILLIATENPNIIISFYCSMEDSRSLARLKLFTKWFNLLNVKNYSLKKYHLKDSLLEYYGGLVFNNLLISDDIITKINKAALSYSNKVEIDSTF